MARILPYPWSLCLHHSEPGASVSIEDGELAGPFNIESLTFFTRSKDEATPKLPGRRHGATVITHSAVLNPQTTGGRRPGELSILPFPIEQSSNLRILFKKEECLIPFYGGLRRASVWEDPGEHNSSEVRFRDTIDLLSGYFTEAIFLTHDKTCSSFRDFAGQAVARLDWQTIWNRWKLVSTGDEPRMARVVEIAFSHLLGIRDVCERPRRMLIRQREMVPVGRVQELDAVCLRNLIQRPGHTVLEKAGTRQEIMAITRRETVDTAENRVVRAFIRLCQHRARAYERENGRALQRHHSKVKAVVDLRATCERLDWHSPISTVGRLVGLPRPNYVLQKDRRYHPLWDQFEKLRREEMQVDNIWAWGRRLWAEFVRSVVVSFLCSEDARTSCGWHSDGTLAAYIRTEHQEGLDHSFIPALSVSSRWKRTDGPSLMFVVHPSHGHLAPGLEGLIPRLAPDLALAIYTPNLGSLVPSDLLCIYSVLSLRTNHVQRQTMVSSLESSMNFVAEQNPRLNVRALLLRGDGMAEQPTDSSRSGRLDYLSAPAGGPYWFQEFPDLLSVLLEEMVS